MSRKSVQGGWCSRLTYYGSKCALERSECPNDHVYYSSHQTTRDSCSNSAFVREKSLGQCTDGTCSPNEASCGDMDFNSSNNTKTCPIEDTLFGRCGDRCLWSPDDCVDESWSFPSADCSCDQVQVGACQKDDYTSCAVSSDACEREATWLSPSEVVSTTDIRCYLCREDSTGFIHDNDGFINDPDAVESQAPSSLVQVTYSPVEKPNSIVQQPYSALQEQYSPVVEDNTKSSSMYLLIGGISGGVIGTAMVCALFLYVRNRQIQTSKDDGEKTAPCSSVDISKKDDVSLLSNAHP